MSMRKGFTQEEIKKAHDEKNERDWKYQISQAVQNLDKRLSEISLSQEKIQSENMTGLKSFLIELENLNEEIHSKVNKFDQRIGDIESKISRALKELTTLSEELNLKFIPKQLFFDELINTISKLEKLEEKLEVRSQTVDGSFTKMKSNFQQDLETIKQELTPKIPEIDPIKQQLDERFNVLQVDFAGLIREIGILKKAVTYDQKKFENIYTLIERMKEGKT